MSREYISRIQHCAGSTPCPQYTALWREFTLHRECSTVEGVYPPPEYSTVEGVHPPSPEYSTIEGVHLLPGTKHCGGSTPSPGIRHCRGSTPLGTQEYSTVEGPAKYDSSPIEKPPIYSILLLILSLLSTLLSLSLSLPLLVPLPPTIPPLSSFVALILLTWSPDYTIHSTEHICLFFKLIENCRTIAMKNIS
jgi:hypothetical protein